MQPPQTINPIINFLPIILIFVIFYFMVIRPQKNKEKEHQEMLNKLNKNDEVVTSSGIHGTIVSIKDKTAVLRVDENVKIEIERNCIAYLKKV